jgi:hypothetical protein
MGAVSQNKAQHPSLYRFLDVMTQVFTLHSLHYEKVAISFYSGLFPVYSLLQDTTVFPVSHSTLRSLWLA